MLQNATRHALHLPTGNESAEEWKTFFTAPDLQSKANDTAMTVVIQETASFVQEKLQNQDASHDWNHIERVWDMARRLAREEKLSAEDTSLVELAALLHYIVDWKYSGDEAAGVNAARTYLEANHQGILTPAQIDKVAAIIKGVGFKEELSRNGSSNPIGPSLACVQDADRLDAIGSIGVARCLTYGGHKKRPLYGADCPPRGNLTKEQYMATKNEPTLNHFYEKLFKLKDMMKTEAGKRIAQERYMYMETFVRTFLAEVRTEA